MSVRITISGSDKLAALKTKVTRAAMKLVDRRAPAEAAKKYMTDRWQTNFTSQGGIYGGWPPLAAYTLANRGGGGDTLYLSGGLFGDLMSQADAALVGEGVVFWHFERGSHWLYTHHFGMANPWPNAAPIPSRPLWGMNDDDEAHIEQIFEQFVDEVLAEFG